MSAILGLDISTSCVGIAILDDYTGDLLSTKHIELNKKVKKVPEYKDLWDKADKMYDVLKEISENENISMVYIEAPAKGGFGGKTNANTITNLIQFNSMISWMVRRLFNHKPEYINVRSARKICGIGGLKGTPKENKTKVCEFFIDEYPQFVVEYTRYGNIKTQCLDESDAICIAKAGYIGKIKIVKNKRKKGQISHFFS